MTPAEAARAVAEDYDLMGDPSAEWMATAWRRFADKLDPPAPAHDVYAFNCIHNSHVPGFYDKNATCQACV